MTPARTTATLDTGNHGWLIDYLADVSGRLENAVTSGDLGGIIDGVAGLGRLMLRLESRGPWEARKMNRTASELMDEIDEVEFLHRWRPTSRAVPKQCWFNARRVIQKLDRYGCPTSMQASNPRRSYHG